MVGNALDNQHLQPFKGDSGTGPRVAEGSQCWQPSQIANTGFLSIPSGNMYSSQGRITLNLLCAKK